MFLFYLSEIHRSDIYFGVFAFIFLWHELTFFSYGLLTFLLSLTISTFQVPIYKLLEKYNNMTEVEYKTYDATYLKKFEITKLPKYLILAIKRFVLQKIALFINSI